MNNIDYLISRFFDKIGDMMVKIFCIIASATDNIISETGMFLNVDVEDDKNE